VKKLILSLVLFFGIVGASLFAWEPNDLTKFPSFTKEGDWILNFGVGFGVPAFSGSGYIYFPPVRLSFDRNTTLGDRKLPFFFGGIVSYSGEGYSDDWFVSRISLGVRFGYHFNWGVDRLDTYAVTTAGWIIHAGKDYSSHFSGIGEPLYGVDVGARYFISDGFGFWAEAGFGAVSFFNVGLSFKF